MPLHMIKLSVGIEDIDHLKSVQESRRRLPERAGKLWHQTRQTPRRASELLDGGSIYWVIKGMIRARQGIEGFDTLIGGDGIKRCRIFLDSTLVPTDHWPRRPFQGWRYLEEADAPKDLDSGESGADMPPELVAELRALGLL